MNKVSILMPTYNDEKYIKETIESVLEQTYENWELLICDDGSTDNTKQVVEKYIKQNSNIKYFYQKNADQLNAIIKLIPHITGDFVYILHSDDLLFDKCTLKNMVDYMKLHNCDSIIGDVATIDSVGNVTGKQKVSKYIFNKRIMPLQLLWLGRNLYIDMAFHKKDVFINQVYNNYLLWNGPFWLNLADNNILNVEKVSFPFFKYRVFEENYINTEGANLNVINGEIRVITRLLSNYDIPFYNLQYIVYRIFNKLNIGIYYPVVYLKRESKNKSKIINFVLDKRFNRDEINNNMFLKALTKFYQNYRSKQIYIKKLPKKGNIYFGKDMRIFNKKLKDKTIDSFYINIFKNMEQGFNEIVLDNLEDLELMTEITKFLCIYPYVKITANNKIKE